MDSPEYDAVIQCFPKLFSIIQQSPVDVAVQLVPCGILAPGDLVHIRNPKNNDNDKALTIINAVCNQVQSNSQVFGKFVLALETTGSWTKTVVGELQCTHMSLLNGPPKKFCSSGAENVVVDPEGDHRDVAAPESPKDSTSSSGIADVDDKEFVKIKCECGKCSILGYINGEDECSGSRPPQIKRWTPDPPYHENKVSLTEMPYKLFKIALGVETQNMHDSFCDLLDETFESLENKADLSRVKRFTRSLLSPALKGKHHEPLYDKSPTGECLDKITQYDQLREFLEDNYCSWFNYTIIVVLRKKYLFKGGSTDESLLEYQETFLHYIKRRCFLYDDDFGPKPHKIQMVQALCKIDIDFDLITYHQVELVRLSFVKCLNHVLLKSHPYQLSEYNVTLKHVHDGCTELAFRAPEYLENFTVLTLQQVCYLKGKGFIDITVGGNSLLSKFDSETAASVTQDEVYSSTCSDSETSSKILDSGSVCSEETDMDTSDIELTLSESEVSYDKILDNVCKEELEIDEEMQLEVSPCSFRKAFHNRQSCMAVVYTKSKDDKKFQFCKFVNDVLADRQNVLKVNCVHFDNKLSHHPILLYEPEQPLKEYCSSCGTISEIEQLSILLDIALATLGFSSGMQPNVTKESIFVHKDSNGEIKALFSPLYKYSYFLSPVEPRGGFDWIREVVLLMHYRDQYSKHTELPESHILYNIFKYKWFSDKEEARPEDKVEVAKEIEYILDLEKTRLGLIGALRSADILHVSHLHMLLIGHTGVGKTSVCKHLQNIPFSANEKSTVIMEQQLLCQETIEASVFKKSENVYKSEPDKVFLTLWDTGGQPMFQDLIPCFAKLRSIYGIVFRLCDLLKNSKAVVRPICSLESAKEMPYTYMEYIYRCFAFLDFFSSGMYHNFGNLPPEIKSMFLESIELHSFPKLALIGTFKDTVREDEIQLNEQLKESVQHFQFNFLPSDTKSGVFEIDNTRSGKKFEDFGIINLRKQVVASIQNAKVKVPSKWIFFKIELEHESQLQQPCTGVIAYENVVKIAQKYKIDPKSALCYFNELGIFLWYYEKESLKDYVIIEPKNLINILGTILNPERYEPFSKKLWDQLQTKGLLVSEIASQLLQKSRTGLPLRWIFSFFEEHHLAIPLNEGYFIPSMLRVLPICQNYLHVYETSDCFCTSLIHRVDLTAAPLFLVPRLKCIPSGFFSRLMTVLAGIRDHDEIVWNLSLESNSCKNVVTFVINDQACVSFTEFINCVRILVSALPGKTISGDLCRGVLSQLRVQLQRAFPQTSGYPVSVTFACLCSNKHHFLPTLPSTTETLVYCNEQPNSQFVFTEAHKMWITKPSPKTNEDAERLFEEALNDGSVFIRITNLLFVGSIKKVILKQEETTMLDVSNWYIVDNYEIKNLQTTDSKSYLANSAAFPLKKSDEIANTLPSEEAETVFESENIKQAYKSSSPEIAAGTPKRRSSLDIPSEIEQLEPLQIENVPIEDWTQEHTDQSSTLEVAADVGTDQNILSDMEIGQSESIQVDNTPTFDHWEGKSPDSIEDIADTSKHVGILNLMCARSEEQRQLNLIHAIESDDGVLVKLLPLFSQPFSIGVVSTELIGMLNGIEHIPEKWMIIQMESDKTTTSELPELSCLVKDKLVVENTVSDIGVPAHAACKTILKIAGKAEKQAVPYAWYYLYHCIQDRFRETQRKVISYSEVSLLCHHCNIRVTDLNNILNFLHACGLLVYFEKILPNQIFDDITVLISILKSVLNDTVLTMDNFQKVETTCFGDNFTHANVVELFKGLFLICQMDKQSFLMPHVLESKLNRKDLSQFCKQTSDVPFLSIQYPTKDYEFAFLICFVVSNCNQNPWPWKLLIKQQSSCIFKNCVQFLLPGYHCIVTLFASKSFIEVHVQCLDNKPPLTDIRIAIVTGLHMAHNSFCLTETFSCEVGFFCPCNFIEKEHLVVFSEKKQQWICSENSEAIIKITHSQQIWFDNDAPREDNLTTVNGVFKALLPHCDVWFKIGIDLGLDSQTLSRISVGHKDSTDIALMVVVRSWFHNNPSPNWSSVNTILQSVGNKVYSDSDRQLYDSSEKGDTEQVAKLLTQDGADPDAYRDSRCQDRALHRACYNNYYKIVKLLLKHKADPNAMTVNQFTPLHVACLHGHLDCVRYLMDSDLCNVDTELKNCEEKTAVQLAENKRTVKYKQVVEYAKLIQNSNRYSERTMYTVDGNLLGHSVEFSEKLLKELHDVLRDLNDNWYFFGIELGIGTASLDEINNDNHWEEDCFRSMLEHYLTHAEPHPQWSDIIKALLSPVVDCPHLISRVAELAENEIRETGERTGNHLSEEDFDALQRLLQRASVKLPPSQLTFEKIQQLLLERGHGDLATNLRAELDKVIRKQQQYLKKLEDLLADSNTIDICYLKTFLVGPPGVGKTTTLNRLLKIITNLCSAGDRANISSTLLANCIQVFSFVSSDGTRWISSSDFDRESILLFRYLCGCKLEDLALEQKYSTQKYSQEKKQKSLISDSESTMEISCKKGTKEDVAHHTIQPNKVPSLSKSKITPAVRSEDVTQGFKADRTRIQRSRIHSFIARLQKVIMSEDHSFFLNLSGSTLLSIFDIGGQPNFLEMLPALSMGPAMYLVFMDLSKKLDELYKISFNREDTVITPYSSVHTVESTILQILSAITNVHCISHEMPQLSFVEFRERVKCFQQIKPVATLIGTHKDQVMEQRLENVNEALSKITSKFPEIIACPSVNRCFFAVDNFLGTDQTDIGPIRDFLSDTFQTHFKDAVLPIRPKWLWLSLILRREFKIVSIVDFNEIAERLEIDREDGEFFLWYSHYCTGTLMYYPDVPDEWFKNHVICSPQVVFDSISQLILASMRTFHTNGELFEHERIEMIKMGQFSIESIEKYCTQCQVKENLEKIELIPPKQLIMLLNHANLLSPIIHKEKDGSERITYFMPAVLECASPEVLVTPPLPNDNNPEPLYITFSYGYVPTGTFCGLIAQLVSLGPHGILGLTWKLVECGVKRDCVSFHVDYVNQVTLLSHDSCYELRVKRKNFDIALHDLCSYVLSVILYILKRLYKNLLPLISFQCPCPKHSAYIRSHHLCTLRDFRSSVNFFCERQVVRLRTAQKIWIGKNVTSGSSAELEVLKYADDYYYFSFDWTKNGSRHPIRTASQPNVLTFQNVSEKDFGYYKCEVKEAGRVVLTIHRALFRDESNTSHSEPFSSGAHGIMTLEKLAEVYSISSDQLDCEIEDSDMILLAGYFDNVEYYLHVLRLTPAEQVYIRKKVGDGNQIAMKHCLLIWKQHNPSTATLRTLLEILLRLKKEEIALNVCKYYCPKHK